MYKGEDLSKYRREDIIIAVYVCMYGHIYSKSMDRPDEVTNPARGQLNRENG